MPHRLYRQVALRASHYCEYCSAPEEISPDRFHVEHILPRSLGGSDAMSNLALSCSLCNQRKSHVTMAVDPGGQDLTIVRLFNPRVDLWAAHFGAYLFDDRIEIRGRTRIGRATVSQLNMNDPHAVRARLLWALMNLFPP